MKLLEVEYDPMMKIRTETYADGEGGLVIREEQDVEGSIELNKAQNAQVDERARWTARHDRELGAHVARIPMIVLMQWQLDWKRKRLSNAEVQADLRRKLNDPDNRFFRTRPGRV